MHCVIGGGIHQRREAAAQRMVVFGVHVLRDFRFPVGEEVAQRAAVYQVEPLVSQTPPVHRKVRREDEQRPLPAVDTRPRRCRHSGSVDGTVDGTLPRVSRFVHSHPFALEQIVSDEMAEDESCKGVIHNSMMPNHTLLATLPRSRVVRWLLAIVSPFLFGGRARELFVRKPESHAS